MRISETFYAELWRGFIADRRGAWLPTFLRQKRRKSGEDFSNASLDELLALLADRNRGLRLSTSGQEWVLSLGGEALQETLSHVRGKQAKYQQLQKTLEGRADPIPKESLDRLRNLVLDAAVEKDAWDFFYNIGFLKPEKHKNDAQDGEWEPPTAEEEANKAFTQSRQTPRRKDRAFEMLDKWCEDTSHTLHASYRLTPETRRAWNEMALLLQQMEKPTNLVLPVQIDPTTGIGLYLVGLEQYWDNALKEQLAGLLGQKGKPCHCIFLCFGPSDFVDETTNLSTESLEKKLKYGSHLHYSPIGDAICCVTLEEGEQLFRFLLDNEWMSYKYFRENNGPAPPGTPKLLEIFFEQDGQNEDLLRENLVKEGKADFANDQKQNPMPPKMG